MTFNVRVYGILIDDKKGILVSDELILGINHVKFPGGGMEYGEGTKDCLKREFREELNLKIEVGKHFYTTDFFQESAFKKNDQLIAVYYYVKPLEPIHLDTVHFDHVDQSFEESPHADRESFRFIPFSKFHEDLLSFPVDKVVGKMLRLNGLHP